MRISNLLAGASAALLAGAAPAAFAAPALNDTGATLCVSPQDTFTADCAGTGQDGEFGRDVTHANDFNGRAGFRFAKLDTDGAPLPAGAERWICLKDRVTGLTWEMKSESGPHAGGKKYTNYGDGRPGDASEFVRRVNAAGYCGASDWRLPTVLELQSIVDYGATSGAPIDRAFPNTAEWWYWASTLYGTDPDASWSVFFSSTAGGDGAGNHMFRLSVRLVRGPVADTRADRFVASGDEVTDTLTGLVWRRCSEGQTWSGGTCSGRVAGYQWQEAMAQANAEAARTGKGWRVPNAKELASVADRTRVDPAIDPVAFPGTPRNQWYWSSTPFAADPSIAWANEFSGGYTTSYPARGYDLGIRLVR